MRMLLDIVRQSLSTLWAHKLRSFLTMFGIAWGVGSLATSCGLGRGLSQRAGKTASDLGPEHYVYVSRSDSGGGGQHAIGQTYYFTYKDYLAIRNEAQFVGALSPVLNREDIRAVSDYGSTNGQVFGVASDYNQIRNVPIEPGRWFNNQDNAERRRVAVVGWELLKNMFPGRPAVGSTILLNGVNFDIVGVVAKVGRDGNNGTNSRIFIPIDTMRDLFPLTRQTPKTRFHLLTIARLSKDLHAEAKEEIHRIIARRHGFNPKLQDAFEDWDTIENIEARRQDLRCDGLVPRRGRSRDPGTGCDRNHQHHAGLGDGADERDWIAQGSGRNLPARS